MSSTSTLGYIGTSEYKSNLEVGDELYTTGASLTDQNIGASPSTGMMVTEYGDANNHVTKITFAGTDTLTIASGADAVGTEIYEFPAGNYVIESVALKVTLTGTGVADADTPDVGVGSVVATGAVATLGGTATFEDVVTGQTAANCNGTALNATVIPNNVYAETAAKKFYLNVADIWAGADTLSIGGSIVIKWTSLA